MSGIADIAWLKVVAGVIGHRQEIIKVAGIGQFIIHHYLNVAIFLYHVLHKIGADEAGSACDQYIFHNQHSL